MINTSYEGHVVGCKRVTLLDLLERDQSCGCDRTFRIGITRVVSELFYYEIYRLLILVLYKRQLVRQGGAIPIDVCRCLGYG